MAIRRATHAIYELNYHFVWSFKYRRRIAHDPEIRKFLENLFPNIAQAYGFIVEERNIQPDHVHLYLSAPPRLAPSRLVEILKSVSGREVFKKFPKVKQSLWGGDLWSDGYFVRAVGDKVTSFIIQRYIKYQHDEDKGRQQKLF